MDFVIFANTIPSTSSPAAQYNKTDDYDKNIRPSEYHHPPGPGAININYNWLLCYYKTSKIIHARYISNLNGINESIELNAKILSVNIS